MNNFSAARTGPGADNGVMDDASTGRAPANGLSANGAPVDGGRVPAGVRPGTGWAIGRAVLTMAGLLGYYAISLVLLAPLGGPLDSFAERGDVPRMIAGLVTATIVALSGLVVVWALARFVDHSSLRSIALVPRAREALPFLGALVATAAVLMVSALALQPLGLLRAAEPRDGTSVLVFVVVSIVLGLVMQALPEELLFRGYLLRHTPLRIGPAIWLSAAAFGLMHLISSGGQQSLLERVLYLAGPFGFAVLAGAVAARYRSTWASVGVHAGAHLGTMAMTLLGLGSGPVHWVLQGLILSGLGVLVMRTLPATELGTDLLPTHP